MQPSGTSSRPLRFRLFLLAASGLVPLALMLLFSTAYIAQERSTGTRRAALELSRAIAIAVDSELQATVALLESLAIGTQLQDVEPSDLARGGFAARAQQAVQRQGWRTIVVANGRGEVLMRSDGNAGQPPTVVEPASMAQVVATRAPAIGRVAKGPRGQDAFAVRVPVQKDGQLRYVLSAVVPTDRVLAVVARQQLDSAWVVGVFDQDGYRVARSMATASPRFSPTLEELVKKGGQEGMGPTYTLEGVPSHTGFSRVRASQWVVAVGIPVSQANADFYRQLAAVGAGTIASLGLLAWLAWRTARSISGPIDSLKQAAGALGAGQHLALPPLDVEELDAVAQALRRAAADREAADEKRALAEAEREQALLRLGEALRVAEQANRNKDEFLALLGHELRNPLAPITNALHLMQLKGDAATAQERAIIQRQLHYVTRLVDDLLDASRIASRRFAINLRPLRPVALLEQTCEALRPMLGGRRLEVQIDPAARPLWVSADEARLVQVFNNLLGNAIKFTETSGVLRVRAAALADGIEFSFSDDGAGMSREDLERAFELFYQAPLGNRAVNGGLGLGLAIVQSLVEMHGGSVTAASDGRGQGTTVSLRLPLGEPPAAEPAAAPAGPEFTASKALVVDDNVDAADTLAMLLEVSGFMVRVAYTPQDALAAVPQFQPHVAVLDIGLPGMDGYELARTLRAADPPYTGALVALTGYGQQQDVQRALAAGFDAHQTKPVAPDALLALVARLLDARKRA